MKPLYKFFSYLNTITRIILLGLHFISGTVLLFVYRLTWGKQWFYSEKGARAIQRWMKTGSRILGLRLHVCGTPYIKSTVMVSNHISWIDIVAIAASVPVTFVSKNDLEKWPVIGFLAKASGTLFIKRGSLFSVNETLRKLENVLGIGRKTLFFPEGTTTNGQQVRRFHSGLFEAAYKEDRPVQPVAISYFINGQPDYRVAPYIDQDHFLKHLWEFLLQGKSDIHLDFMDEVSVNDFSRQDLARYCHDRITEVLELSLRIRQDYPVNDEDLVFSTRS